MLSPGDGPNRPLSMKDAGYETCHEDKRGNTALLIQAKFTDTLALTVPNPKPAKWTPPARRSWRS